MRLGLSVVMVSVLAALTFPTGSLAGPVTEIELPGELSSPGHMVLDGTGKLWLTEKVGKHLAEFDPETGVFKTYLLPEDWGGIGPTWIALAPNGDLWFTVTRWADSLAETDILGRFTPADKKFARFKLPKIVPDEILVDEAGAVWIMDQEKISRFDPTTSRTKQFTMPTANGNPRGMVMGRNGIIWFVLAGANKVVGFSTGKELFGEAVIPTPFFMPSGTAVDEQGNVWFAGVTSNKLAVYYPERRIFNQMDLPSIRSLPTHLAHDGQGGVWFLEYRGNQIGRLDPKMAAFRVFEIPTANSQPSSLVLDQKRGTLWFVETATEARKIGRLSIAVGLAQVEAGGTGKNQGQDWRWVSILGVLILGTLAALFYFRRATKVH